MDLSAIRRAVLEIAAHEDAPPLLVRRCASRRLVLLGEATHGTSEFYRLRARVTKELIEHHGFAGVAIEGDWPHVFQVNRYVRGTSHDSSAEESLRGFTRFPAWMWRNGEVEEFVEWLRRYNAGRSAEARAGIYGLDLYSLFSSIQAIMKFLEREAPHAVTVARRRYECFEAYAEDPQMYGFAASIGRDCTEEAIAQLVSVRKLAAAEMQQDGDHTADEHFSAEQNAEVIRSAERYYRAMFTDPRSTWNLRDRHMFDTLMRLQEHLSTLRGDPARIVVWAHNSHLGDARATEMGKRQWNLGQLCREAEDSDCVLVGFTTDRGSVAAASAWDAPVKIMEVRSALPESYEHLLSRVGPASFYLPLGGNADIQNALAEARLERAIGVIYRPESERDSHYFSAQLSKQFDELIHVAESNAITLLDHRFEPARSDAEAYPTGL